MREAGVIPEQNIVIKQGSTFQLAVGVVDSAGLPVTVTGYTGYMQIRHQRGDDDPPLVSLSIGSGLTMLGTTILVDIHGDDTEEYTWTDGVYDLFVINGDDEPFCVLQGKVRVDHRVTVLP